MTRSRLLACLVALTALALVPAARMAHASPVTWIVDPAGSRLTFHPVLAGGEFAGRFERFDATIRFDAADLTQSSLVVVVDLLAARTGDGDRDTALQGDEFFATQRWPRARFASTGIRPLGGNRYEVSGTLTLRDATHDVRLDLRFDPQAPSGGAARMTGTTTVRRLDFGVGQGEWRATEWLQDSVRIEFDLRLRAAH